jgi:hypothetical protein
MTTSIGVEDFCKIFEDFCLIACILSSTITSFWYVDIGASCHMTGRKEFFSSL